MTDPWERETEAIILAASILGAAVVAAAQLWWP